jgi:hypothetical protein
MPPPATATAPSPTEAPMNRRRPQSGISASPEGVASRSSQPMTVYAITTPTTAATSASRPSTSGSRSDAKSPRIAIPVNPAVVHERW